MEATRCSRCNVKEYNIEKKDTPLCSLCRKEFQKWYDEMIYLLPRSSSQKDFYEEQKKKWVDIRF